MFSDSRRSFKWAKHNEADSDIFSTMKVYTKLELFGYIDVSLDMWIWYQNNKLDRMKKYQFRG